MRKATLSLLSDDKLKRLKREETSDELFLSERSCQKWFTNESEHRSVFVVAISDHHDFDRFRIQLPSLFVVTVCDELNESEHHNRGSKIVLYASSNFIAKHCARKPFIDVFVKRIDYCVPFDKLVIGVKDNHLFHTLTQDEHWENTFRSKICKTEFIPLCRIGENFFGNEQLEVIDCEPIIQGVVSINTKFIFVQIQNKKQTRNQESPFLKLSSASSFFAQSNQVAFHIILLNKSETIKNCDTENGTVFLSQSSLLKLGLNKDDWVKIWLKGNEQHWRWAKVMPYSSENEKFAYVCPLLWFNLSHRLQNAPTKLIQPEAMLIVSSEKSKDIPTFAKGVHISLIQSPDYTGDIDFSLILKTYFGQPRIVMKGDVIAIHSKFDLLFYNKAKEEIRDTWPLIFFKVSRIEGDGCLLDTENSKLYQTGTTKYFVPLSMYNYYFENEASIDFLHRHIERLSNLVTPYLSLLKKVVTLLLSGLQGSGKTYIVKSLCKLWNLHLYEVDCNSILCDTPSATEAKLKVVFDKITRYAPCIVLFSYFELMCRESNGNDPRVFECFRKCLQETCDELPIIIIIETADPDIILNSEFGILFTHHFSIDYLNEIERLEILQLLLGQRILSGCLDIFDLVKRTSGFVFDDLNILVKKAINASYRRISSQTQAQLNELDVALSGVVITKDDFSVALADLHKAYNQAIGAPTVPKVEWEDIGGLNEVKKEILETITFPLEHKELMETGLKRSGILLYGPPGTGKTLLAKAVASQCELNFLSVKGPEIINMYVGQSEENVRTIFKKARNASPCVVFFDELDSIAPNRGKSGDSGGVMDRVVSQLLAEIDGINKNNQVFIIGATNRPDLLDPALLRPGRFDRLVYVGVAEDVDSRLKILQALTRNFQLHEDCDLSLIEEKCPQLLTGADFYSLCSSAMISAIERSVLQLEKRKADEESTEIEVRYEDFVNSISSLKPSISEKEMKKYKNIKESLNSTQLK